MSSQEDNEQFLDTVASPLYSVSITTLPGEGITNTRNKKTTKIDDVSLKTINENNSTNTAIIGPRHKRTCLRGFVNNTGADQPAHQRSLISTFVIDFLESTIFNLATGKISIF